MAASLNAFISPLNAGALAKTPLAAAARSLRLHPLVRKISHPARLSANRSIRMDTQANASQNAADSSVANDENEFWGRISAHQRDVPKPSLVEEARTVMDRCTRGSLATVSKKYEGFPFGSLVDFAADTNGCPLLAISTLSPHTADLTSDPRCSLLVSRDPLVRSSTAITLVGTAEQVPPEEREAVREAYLQKHPSAFWVDFGDFSFIRIRPVKVRITANVASFAAGASVAEFEGDEFMATPADPVAPFEAPIAGHMNKDHSDAIAAMVNNELKVEVTSARILNVDRFGLLVEAPLRGELSRIRLPFPRPAESRKDVKDLIVEMTRAAADAAS